MQHLKNPGLTQIRNLKKLIIGNELMKQETAVRCLMLFPLNALVEDQNTRLRKIFTGTRGKELSNLINGNRIYFGSYKGESGGSPNLTQVNSMNLKNH